MRMYPNDLIRIQRKIARDLDIRDSVSLDRVKQVVGFDCAMIGTKLICAATIFSFPSMKLVEKKMLIRAAQLPYIPQFLAFREGPLILELYHELENNPDVLMVDDHGIAHPEKCGMASYVGAQLGKPTIGVAKSLLTGAIDDGKIMINNELRGYSFESRKFAKPLFVSPGNLITAETALDIVKQCIVQPHKLPEPLHLARRIADKAREKLAPKQEQQHLQQHPVPEMAVE